MRAVVRRPEPRDPADGSSRADGARNLNGYMPVVLAEIRVTAPGRGQAGSGYVQRFDMSPVLSARRFRGRGTGARPRG